VERPTLATMLDIAVHQHGVVSQEQLQAEGFSRDRIAGLVTAGVLIRVIDGAYRIASHRDNELARCASVGLARPALVVSGPTAARLHGFRRVPGDGFVHVTAKPHAQPARAAWIRTYRTAMIADNDVVMRDHLIRLTSPARTVLDMVRYASESAVLSMVEQGLDREWFTEDEIRGTAEYAATPGRPFAGRFLALLDDRLGGGPAGSDWESIVGDHLRGHGITGIVRQFPLTVRGYGNLRFDLAVPARRWALEIDVHPSHYSREGAARDKLRDRCCAEIGWLVQRVGEPDLRHRLHPTLDSIERTLANREPLRPTG